MYLCQRIANQGVVCDCLVVFHVATERCAGQGATYALAEFILQQDDHRSAKLFDKPEKMYAYLYMDNCL